MSKEPVEQEILQNITWSMDLISNLQQTMRNSELLMARVRQFHEAQQLVCSSRYIKDMSKRRLQLSSDFRYKPARRGQRKVQSDGEL